MYAILVVDAINEKSSVLATLASDEVAADVLMLTTAKCWCIKQPVDLGYTVSQQDIPHRVTVTCGTHVVLSITAQSINALVSSADIMTFVEPGPIR